ncbi:hypothetical protein DYB32_007304, partial [Aphanomyces invadans]
TVGHTGVMSLLYIALADAKPSSDLTVQSQAVVESAGGSAWVLGGGIAVAVAVVAGIVFAVYQRQAARAGYDKVTEATPVTN